MKLKIGINLLFLKPKTGGGSVTYALNLLEKLSCIDEENEYFLFTNIDSTKLMLNYGENFKLITFDVSFNNIAKRYFFEQVIFPFKLKKYKLDILHSLGYVCPLFYSGSLQISSILDLNYIGHKDNMPFYKRLILGSFIKLTARRVKHIITISNFSKEQILKYLNIAQEKVTVTHLAGRANENNLKQKITLIKDKYRISKPYLVALSSLSKHKNIDTLLKGFKIIVNKRKSLQLVLVGLMPREGDHLQVLVKRLNLKKRVIFTGFIEEKEMMPMLSGAEAFIFPSFYEGFGLPLLDAQAAGTYVISSNAGSLPEVGGYSASYFEPMITSQLVSEVDRFLSLREDEKEYLKLEGINNSKRFSWELTAFKTLSIYQNLKSENI